MATRHSKQEKSAPVDTTSTTATGVDEAEVERMKTAPAAEVDAAAPVLDGAARPASDAPAQPRVIAPPQPIPGMSVIGRGIYIKPRQPYELKASLFELGQRQDQLFMSGETGQSYFVPENCVVNNSPPAPSDQSLGETVIEESWDRFGKELTLNVNAAVSSSLINIDPSAIRAASLRSEEDSYYALRSSFIAFWNISLVDVPEVPALEKEVDELPAEPLDPTSRGAYARIFDKYGSHYVKSAWIGGKASLVFVVAKSSQLTKDEVRAGIQASLGGIFKGGTSTEQKFAGDRFRSSSTCKVFGSGGDRIALAKLSSLDPKVYGDWIESVKHNPQVIQLGLAGIWTLVKNPAKAEALKIAYVQESSFKPISAIIPVTRSFGAGVESRLYLPERRRRVRVSAATETRSEKDQAESGIRRRAATEARAITGVVQIRAARCGDVDERIRRGSRQRALSVQTSTVSTAGRRHGIDHRCRRLSQGHREGVAGGRFRPDRCSSGGRSGKNLLFQRAELHSSRPQPGQAACSE